MDSSPSFNTHSCINTMDIANRVVQELHNDSEFKDLICFIDEEINEAEENTQEDEFEFPLVFTDLSLADNIINDQITHRYPLFDRSLLLNLDSNSSNTIDSKPAPASTPILAPTTNTVSTVTPTSTIVAASTPTLTPATVITPTSTIVAALDKVLTSVTSTPTPVSVTDEVSTSVTSTSTPVSVTDKVSTSVTPTSTLVSITDKVLTSVTATSTPVSVIDKVSTSVTSISTPVSVTDKVSTSVTPTSTLVSITDKVLTSVTATSTPVSVIDKVSTSVTSISTPVSVTDKVSTSVTPTSTPISVTNKVLTYVTSSSTPISVTEKVLPSITPTSTPAPITDTISTPITPTSTQAPATDTISTIFPTLTPDTASAPTLLTASTVTPATNPYPASPPPTRPSLGKLFSEDRDSTQSSTLVLESKDSNTISSPQTYCIWKPQEQEHQLPPKQHHSRGKHKKSNSISISEVETSPKRWRVRDLLKRSYSDDSKHASLSSIFYSPSPKEKIGKDGSVVVFLPPILPKPSNEKVKKPEKALKTTASMGGRCTNHKPEDKSPAYKAKVGNIRLPAFLPYRQDQHQVDAFSNYTNNGPSKHMYR